MRPIPGEVQQRTISAEHTVLHCQYTTEFSLPSFATSNAVHASAIAVSGWKPIRVVLDQAFAQHSDTDPKESNVLDQK